MTNLEWIHSLTEDEVGPWFGRNTICEFIQNYDRPWCHRRLNCEKCVSDWLSAEESQIVVRTQAGEDGDGDVD